MKRIRVLHSELNGELGGIESFLYNVYRFIDKEKVEFDFLTISDTPAYGDKFKKMGSTVYKVPKHINFLGYYFAIDKILREGNYDIVHIHKNSAIDILILKVLQRFPNIKVVVHSHNTFPSVGGKLEKLHKFNRKYLYDNADYRLACSDNAGKWMYGNGAFEIIKNGIDTKGFRFCTEYGEEIRAMYGIQLFQSTHIFNRETGAMSQLAESSTKQWRLADTFVCGRGVPIGKFVRPYLHFKGKEQGRIDLTLTL